MNLVRYEAARTALAECHRVDEVKDIRDKAEAMAAYARQAKDQELILMATEIKVRAERRAGEMLRVSAERGERVQPNGGLNRGRNRSESQAVTPTPTLADIGVTPMQSSRWQQLASMSEEHFEAAVATAKDTAGQVTTAFMLREAARRRPAHKTSKRDEERLQQLQEAKSRGVSMISTYARLTLAALRAASSLDEQERELLSELAAAINQAGSN